MTSTRLKNIAVLGSREDFHATHILKSLREKETNAFLLDTQRFADDFRISWLPGERIGKVCARDGLVHPFSQIDAVFWRNIDTPLIPHIKQKSEQVIAINDSMSLLRTLLLEPNIQWVNHYDAYQFHRVKPRQLALANSLGAKIPKTIISNNPDDIIDFAGGVSQAIFKPVQGGAYTQMLNQNLLQRERLSYVLGISPVTIQEYISGTNIRTFVIGDKTYSASIESEEVDFREDEMPVLTPINTPSFIENLSREICSRFGMAWTAIDWRRNNNGDYYFLEANPSPMFYFFEMQTGYPITDSILQLLLSGNGQEVRNLAR